VTPDETDAPSRARLLLDVLALLLLLAGVVGINTAAFLLTPLAGLVTVSMTAIVAGVALGQAR
jgi:hypothetical protein